MSADQIHYLRPDGVTPAQWSAIRQKVELMLDGHMPWCTDHEDDGDFCTFQRSLPVCDVSLTNGTISGATEITLHIKADTDGLTLGEAGVIAANLDALIEMGRFGNTGRES